MTQPKPDIRKIRTLAEQAAQPGSTYADVQAVWDVCDPFTVLALVEVAEAANEYVTAGMPVGGDHPDEDRFMESLTKLDFGATS